jgi:uncharacterized protein YbcI
VDFVGRSIGKPLRASGDPVLPAWLRVAFRSHGRRERETALSVEQDNRGPSEGSLGLAISNAVVGVMRDYTGRGATKARTIISGDVVVVILRGSLTKGERALVAAGRSDKVLEIRREFQGAMREDCMEKVREILGRDVIAMLSANHIDPDISAETFVLEPES